MQLFTDYYVYFEKWGQLFLQGEYVPRYPLPAMGFIAFLTWFGPAAPYILSIASLLILVAVTKRKALAWVFFAPVAMVIYLGQLDFLFLGLLAIGSPVALALLTLKPQVFLFALPLLLKYDKAQKLKFLFWTAVLYVPVTLIRPGWIVEWLMGMNDGRIGEIGRNVTLFALPAVIAFAVGLDVCYCWLAGKPVNWLTVVNPGYRTYDFVMLISKDASLWLIPISWLLFLLYTQLRNLWPMYLLLPASILLSKMAYTPEPLPVLDKQKARFVQLLDIWGKQQQLQHP